MTQETDTEQDDSSQTEFPQNQNYGVVVPIWSDEQNEGLVRLGLSLARPKQGRVILVGMVLIPEGESLSIGAAQAQARRATLERLRAYFEGQPLQIKPRIRVAYSPWPSLAPVVAHEHADLLLIPWSDGDNTSLF